MRESCSTIAHYDWIVSAGTRVTDHHWPPAKAQHTYYILRHCVAGCMICIICDSVQTWPNHDGLWREMVDCKTLCDQNDLLLNYVTFRTWSMSNDVSQNRIWGVGILYQRNLHFSRQPENILICLLLLCFESRLGVYQQHVHHFYCVCSVSIRKYRWVEPSFALSFLVSLSLTWPSGENKPLYIYIFAMEKASQGFPVSGVKSCFDGI